MELRSLARKHHCSVAFVLTTALYDTIGLDVEERFDDGLKLVSKRA